MMPSSIFRNGLFFGCFRRNFIPPFDSWRHFRVLDPIAPELPFHQTSQRIERLPTREERLTISYLIHLEFFCQKPEEYTEDYAWLNVPSIRRWREPGPFRSWCCPARCLGFERTSDRFPIGFREKARN